MPIVIQPYRPEHERAVADFNRRLQAGGADSDLVFYEKAEPRWLPPRGNTSLYNQFFLAIDNGDVRGGYALKYQTFVFPDGGENNIGYYHHPLSEGIVNSNYAVIGGLLLRDAMQRSPLLYCLGMGGYDRPLPKMLVRLGWSHFLVPFYFRVLKPARFLKEMRSLRTTFFRRAAMDIAAYSGAAQAVANLYDCFKTMQLPTTTGIRVEEVEEFAEWAEDLWKRTRRSASMTAVRDLETLRRLYPAPERQFNRLRITRDGEDIGYAVVGERRRDAKYGNLRVGSILDCWAAPEDSLPIILAASRKLEGAGMELIVSNQSHPVWGESLRKAGFLRAESNFIFAASKQLAELLHPFDQTKLGLHFTRADGDGLPRNF